ncbi:MAG: aldehyde ferredoxin oxidoreductase family protein [Sulfolobales archaeon]
MTTLYGYAGRILYVDLSNQRVSVKALDPNTARNYLGGSGLAAHIIRSEMDLRSDPFSEGNFLVIATGPFNVPYVPASARVSIATRSPLTNAWGEAHVGTKFALVLKKAGFDAVVVYGKSDEPAWIHIENQDVDIKSAKDLWGKNTSETFEEIRHRVGKEVSSLAIGKAGENLVRYSSIVADDGGVAGRSGVGAVMGFKKLKAISVRGTGDVALADPQKLADFHKSLVARMVKSPGGQRLKSFGTAGAVQRYYKLGNIPIRNFSRGTWNDTSIIKISGEHLNNYLYRLSPCWGCPISCKRLSKIKLGSSELVVRTPDYETVCMLGSNLLIDDTETLIFVNHLCNEYGIDTISLGGVLGFAMEAYERGMISAAETEGVRLTFGSAESLVEAVRRIAERKGNLWYILGEGVKRACETIGKNSCDFALHVKGLEVPAHDGRAFFVQGLSYATINRGACHLAWPHRIAQGSVIPELGIREPIDRFQVDQSWNVVKVMQDYMEVFDSLVMCKYAISAGVEVKDVLELLRMITGWEISAIELAKTGERIFNLKRLLNVKWGITSKDDVLPRRMLEPLQEGGAAGKVPDLELMLKKYYEIRGWTQDGIPTEEKLRELGLL